MQVAASCGGRTATDTLNVPRFHDYEVSSAAIGGVLGVVSAPVDDGLVTESTTIVFPAIAQGSVVDIGLTEEVGSPTLATIVSCTTNGGGTKISNVVWNRPWIP